MKARKLIVKAMHLIGIILFIGVVWFSGPEKIIKNFQTINPVFYLISLFIILPVMVMKVIKWNYLLKCSKKNYPILRGMEVWIIASYAGVITPARLGDFIRAYYAKKDLGVNFGRAVSTIFVDRVFDVGTLFVLAVIGVIVLGYEFKLPSELIYSIILFFAIFVVAILLFTRKSLLKKIARPFFNALVPLEHAAKIKTSFDEFFEGLKIMIKNKSNLIKSFIVTVISWQTIFFSYYILGLAFGLNIDIVFLTSILPIVILLETLPVSFAGVGVRDVSIAFFFAFKGIAVDKAVAFSIAVLSMNIIVAALGLFLSQKEKLLQTMAKLK